MNMKMLFDLINEYKKEKPHRVETRYIDEINPNVDFITFREDDLFDFMIKTIEKSLDFESSKDINIVTDKDFWNVIDNDSSLKGFLDGDKMKWFDKNGLEIKITEDKE